MKYLSKREQLKDIIEKIVIPAIKKKDVDYYKLLIELIDRIGVSKEIVEDVLKSFIISGKVKEIRVLTIPDEKINNWLDDLIKEEKQTKKDLEVLECQKEQEIQ